MFSKEESARIRREFWTSFGKSFPRKWLLYNTKIKDLSLKFYADRKTAAVMIDIEMKDEFLRKAYYEKFLSLKNIFLQEISGLIFEENFILDNAKFISRIYLPIDKKVSIHNKDSWSDIYNFFYTNMDKLEQLFWEYEDFIKGI